ncbi:MAG: tRNA (adenosine(37)-N6)-threonylcarbamoyltransferase complex dimerization subunit type 1 TsaB [Granulosicoccaceae bacterium]
MNILAFDTATDACSVALLSGERTLTYHQYKPQQQAALLLPAVDQLMAEAGLTASLLDGVVFGRGPGSFTGLRIAASAAQGIAFGADVGVIGVSTLAAIAQGCMRTTDATDVLVLLDARLSEVYCARYQQDSAGLAKIQGEEQLLAPSNLAGMISEAMPLSIAGSGVAEYREIIQPQLHDQVTLREDCGPDAMDLLTLAMPEVKAGQWVPPEAALPVYIRDRVALTEAERKVK